MEIDVLTGMGFEEIKAAFGEEKAWEAKIAALKMKIEETRSFRWFSEPWKKQLFNAEFELFWFRRQQDLEVAG